jgi:hypothetical protein
MRKFAKYKNLVFANIYPSAFDSHYVLNIEAANVRALNPAR